jgi:hypothetical protein
MMPGTPASFKSVFFEHVPADIDAPVVIEATIYNSTDVDYAHDGTFLTITLMKARVDRVIKGSMDTRHLKIFVLINSCAHVGVGRGIIPGTLRSDQAIQKADMRDWSREFFARHVALHDAVLPVRGSVRCQGSSGSRLPLISNAALDPNRSCASV